MCSVRHRPIPSAPRSRAFLAWSGVSAFARTRSRRTSSACAISASNACQIFSSRASASPARAFSSTDSSSGSSPTNTLPVKPSIVMTSPSFTAVPFAVKVRSRRRELDRVGAAHRGDALAAGDHRRVRVGPAGAREDALRRDHAVVVVGRRLAADQDHALALLPEPLRPRRP